VLSVDEKLLDAVTAALHALRTGDVPPPISVPDNLPENEVRQLLDYANRFLVEFALFTDALSKLAQGDLGTRLAVGRMAAAQSLKALQSNLKHLTWKTQQIAGGDLEQKVDFMGDFSQAFNSMTRQLKESRDQLERRNRFIRETFGRYTSDDIVGVLLDLPEGLELGGEKREITLLMSDLRGFTALSERLEPTEVISLLNHYLSAMIDLIHASGGTIDEIIGDAIFVLFGAPLAMPDAAHRAACCALEMQKAMAAVNQHGVRMGWPEIEMGIGLHAGEVVVGNIGSTRRSKYGVVGRAVNLTARIESYTVGGQVLVSPPLVRAAGCSLILGDEVEVHAKGMRAPLACRALLGIEGRPELLRGQETEPLTALANPVTCSCAVLADKHLGEEMHPGALVSLSERRAILGIACLLTPHANLMLRFEGEAGGESSECYAKVIRPVDGPSRRYLIHFTSIPHAIRDRLRRLTDPLAGMP